MAMHVTAECEGCDDVFVGIDGVTSVAELAAAVHAAAALPLRITDYTWAVTGEPGVAATPIDPQSLVPDDASEMLLEDIGIYGCGECIHVGIDPKQAARQHLVTRGVLPACAFVPEGGQAGAPDADAAAVDRAIAAVVAEAVPGAADAATADTLRWLLQLDAASLSCVDAAASAAAAAGSVDSLTALLEHRTSADALARLRAAPAPAASTTAPAEPVPWRALLVARHGAAPMPTPTPRAACTHPLAIVDPCTGNAILFAAVAARSLACVGCILDVGARWERDEARRTGSGCGTPLWLKQRTRVGGDTCFAYAAALAAWDVLLCLLRRARASAERVPQTRVAARTIMAANDAGDNAMTLAVRAGAEAVVSALLEGGVGGGVVSWTAAHPPHGDSVLMLAVRRGRWGLLKGLVTRVLGAPWPRVGLEDGGKRALGAMAGHAAAGAGVVLPSDDFGAVTRPATAAAATPGIGGGVRAAGVPIMDLLLHKNQLDETCITLAAAAGDVDVVAHLVALVADHGDHHDRVRAGTAALIGAAGAGRTAVLRYAVGVWGVDANRRDASGEVALSYAVRGGHAAAVRCLVNEGGADVNLRLRQQQTCATLAAGAGHWGLLRTLVAEHRADANAVNRDRHSPLTLAARAGALDTVVFLLARAADPNAVTVTRDTALTLAAGRGHWGVVRAVLGVGGGDGCGVVVAAGAAADGVDTSGGADVDGVHMSSGGSGCGVDEAASEGEARPGAGARDGGRVGAPLLPAGAAAHLPRLTSATIDAVNASGDTCVALAARAGRGDIVAALAAVGADVHARAAPSADPPVVAAARAGRWDVVQRLRALGADINASGGRAKGEATGAMCLTLAAEAGRWDVVIALLARTDTSDDENDGGAVGAAGSITRTAIDAPGPHGDPCVVLAARGGETRVLRALVAAGADVHRRSTDGTTAVLAAACAQRWSTARWLVKHGADPHARDRRGLSSADLAAAAGERLGKGVASKGRTRTR